jgi:hypothetical protein
MVVLFRTIAVLRLLITKGENDMKKLIFTSLVLLYAPFAYAGEAENILSCVNRANEFSGVKLNEFEAVYEGKILSMSSVKWKNAFCEVKFASVHNLQVNGIQYIYYGFAGKEAYDLNKILEGKTESAINQLKSRVSLLEQRMNQVKRNLQAPRPDAASLTRYINEGVEKSVGIEGLAAAPNVPPAQDSPKEVKISREVAPARAQTPSEDLHSNKDLSSIETFPSGKLPFSIRPTTHVANVSAFRLCPWQVNEHHGTERHDCPVHCPCSAVCVPTAQGITQ